VLRDGALIGIVSRADLLHALQRLLVAEPKTAPSDQTIRRHVLAEAGAAALPPHGLTVHIANGVVTLGGVILDEKMRGALGVAAENVTGVKAVVDRIVWVEPVSNPVIRCPLPSAAENQKRAEAHRIALGADPARAFSLATARRRPVIRANGSCSFVRTKNII
jgi:hypothetical protein